MSRSSGQGQGHRRKACLCVLFASGLKNNLVYCTLSIVCQPKTEENWNRGFRKTERNRN